MTTHAIAASQSQPLETLPLPPGRRGLPLLGETLTFLKDPFGFVRVRMAEHGVVFRTHLLGRNTVLIAGPEAGALWLDEEKLVRDGAMPGHIKELFGGLSLGLIDGAAHKTRKTQLLAGFGRNALTKYLPDMQAIIESFFDRASQLTSEVAGAEALKALALELIAKNVLSIEPGERLDQLLAQFKLVAAGFTGLPIPIPGSQYKKALKARDQIFAIMQLVLQEHLDHPENYDDGLSRILAFKTLDGEQISHEEARLELLHILIAGYILFGQFAQMLIELSRNQPIAAKLIEEMHRVAPTGPLTFAQLHAMPYLAQVVKETKRTAPMIPAIFARAKTTFSFRGFRIPAGWGVFYALRENHQLEDSFAEPETFDPDRFGPTRKEDDQKRWAFAPQGPGPEDSHKCPGTDYATVAMQVFAVVLLRGYDWTIPEQNLEPVWSMIPPEPRDGLRVSFQKGTGHASSANVAASAAGGIFVPESAKPQAPAPKLSKEVLIALSAVIWADDVVTSEESGALLEAARLSGLTGADYAAVEEATKKRIPLDEEVLSRLSSDDAVYVFALANYFAQVDGDVHDHEVQELDRLAKNLGLSRDEQKRAGAASLAVASAQTGGLAALLDALAEAD